MGGYYKVGCPTLRGLRRVGDGTLSNRFFSSLRQEISSCWPFYSQFRELLFVDQHGEQGFSLITIGGDEVQVSGAVVAGGGVGA